jgi:GcrA cell cycle regulator
MEWNEERIEALTRLWREGFSAAQVARQLGGVSRSAVIGKVHRLGIAGREIPSRPGNLGGRPSRRVRVSAGGPARRPATAQAPRLPASPRTAVFEAAPTATILTLSEHGCRWPIGDPGEAGFGFCGRVKTGHGAYCAGHAPMAHSRRVTPMKGKEIDHLVRRFCDAGPWGARSAQVG